MAAELAQILSSPKNVHFVGVGGSGMYPLVQIMLAAGHHISGSDVNEGDILDYERRQGVRVMMGQRAENVHGADLVVYSAAIRDDNPERLEAARLGIPCVERSVMLGYVASLYRRPLCIAGTHGKTTATGMATQILEMAGLNPAAVIGGRLPLINGYGKAGGAPRLGASAGEAGANPTPASGARNGEQERPAAGWGDAIVVEACEYHNTFLELTPECAVLLNVDDDHLEFFGSMENLKAAFRKFCSQATGAVLYNGDDAGTLDVVGPLITCAPKWGMGRGVACEANTPNPRTANASQQAKHEPMTREGPLPGGPQEFISFGLGEGCTLRAVDLYEHKPALWAFTLVRDGEALGEVRLGAPGRHNVYNALAAAGGAMRLGASFGDIAKGLAAFGGTGRRFEVLGQVRGFTVADDYAHHPTELRAVLTTAKEMGYNKVWAVFQPYTYSRTQMLLDDFAEVLPIADRVVMTTIMGGRERAEDYSVTTQDLAEKVPGSVWFETQREVADYILLNAQPGDLVLTLGCGDIYKCAHMLMAGA